MSDTQSITSETKNITFLEKFLTNSSRKTRGKGRYTKENTSAKSCEKKNSSRIPYHVVEATQNPFCFAF